MSRDELLEQAAEIERRLSHDRDKKFADLILTAVGLAAFHQPDAMRRALSGLFDLTETENRAIQAATAAKTAQMELRVILEDLEQRCSRIEARLYRAGKAFASLGHKYKRLLNQIEAAQPAGSNGTPAPTKR